MPTNQILQFAGGGGANVLTPSQYAALTSLLANGFSAGIAPSVQLNTVWRQSSFVAAMIAQFIADNSGQNVNDDGNLATLEANFLLAIKTASVGRLLNTQIITASGNYTPTAGTTKIRVRAIGGGGAGGGGAANSGSQVSVGSGGASGSYAEAFYTTGFSGAVVTIGTAGTGVSAGAGNGGSTTSFGVLLTCPGGGGGQITQLATSVAFAWSSQGSPGVVSSGSGIVFSGAGQPGLVGLIGSGGAVSGQGAASTFGGGGSNTSSGAGNPASGHGAGGGGGATVPSAGAVAGGNGTSGLVIIDEYA